ncbi:Multiple RNA-binding domain-containing protein 1 [Seminavis robusta]|uniref:Multiple RNA-binding domain-containing protein 1 n=1 Tax=Seminavis robusta TaxID=568900 RepID=A0A9N8EC13_9STRA|nr:Multiple RNA-binding domain-containing protein 1 [Seminavis robusta]|eukprot:Sro737_g195080.1 Multiple RNA-binding domain-containing protein 1 (927) ;mRNA; f:3292-6072
MTARSSARDSTSGPQRKRGNVKNKIIGKKKNQPDSAMAPSSSDAPVSSTRLCIKNLPPSFTSLKLREFLEKEFPVRQKGNDDDKLVITDCHVLMHPHKKEQSRRTAFCGFQTTQMAQKVIQLFDQTFALTSRLLVEPAKGPKKSQTQKDESAQKNKNKAITTSKETAAQNNNNNDSKETQSSKKESSRAANSSSSKEMLLAGVGGKNKTKFWSNDLAVPEQKPQTLPLDSNNNQDDNDSSSSDSDDDDDSVASDSSQDSADPLKNATEKSAVVSDLDFLKSKQTLVDNLQEDDDDNDEEDNAQPQPEKPDTDSSSDSDSSSSSDDDSEEEASTQPQAENTPAAADSANRQIVDSKTHHDMNDDNEDETDDYPTSKSLASNRLFVRNVPFTTTEEQLEEHFSSFGTVHECHIPVDDRKISKGFAFVTFDKPQDAAVALQELDGRDFQGRFLHILPSRQKPSENTTNIADVSNLSYKERQELARKQDAAKNTKGWSASFVRGDAVVDSLADRLGIKKGDVLNVKEGLNSGDAAVRLALAETQIIEENRDYFQNHGIDMEALVSMKSSSSSDKEQNEAQSNKRSNKAILVKNLPYDTHVDELTKLFGGVGEAPQRVLLPPSRTIALVEYGHSSDAKKAFRKLAYRRFKSVPIYLEWAPLDSTLPEEENSSSLEKVKQAPPTSSKEVLDNTEEEQPTIDGPTPSIYIKNLNFATTEERLQKYFDSKIGDVRAVRIPTKLAPVKKPRIGSAASNTKDDEMQSLSMGFGFVEFGSQEGAKKALTQLQGTILDGHALELKPSTKSLTQRAAPNRSNTKNPTKVAVRNVPFQASRTELLKLFGSYGQLKRVRLPKKFDGGHRGFAFVEFVTHKEALAAMKSLSRTHLYGRHLVLEWADGDEETGSMGVLRDKAQRDVEGRDTSKQTNRKRQKLS